MLACGVVKLHLNHRLLEWHQQNLEADGLSRIPKTETSVTIIPDVLKDVCSSIHPFVEWERSGSLVECLNGDQRAAGASLTGVTALWSMSKTHLS